MSAVLLLILAFPTPPPPRRRARHRHGASPPPTATGTSSRTTTSARSRRRAASPTVATFVAAVRGRHQKPRCRRTAATRSRLAAPRASTRSSGARAGRAPDPMMLAMNGWATTPWRSAITSTTSASRRSARRAPSARFPWLSANTETGGSARAFRALPAQDRGRREGRGDRRDDTRHPAVGEAREHRGLAWLDPETAVARSLAALRRPSART